MHSLLPMLNMLRLPALLLPVLLLPLMLLTFLFLPALFLPVLLLPAVFLLAWFLVVLAGIAGANMTAPSLCNLVVLCCHHDALCLLPVCSDLVHFLLERQAPNLTSVVSSSTSRYLVGIET